LYIYIYLFSFLTLISIFCICHALVNKVVCVCVTGNRYIPRPELVMEACNSPTVSSNVIALMLSEHKMASLSTRLLSSPIELRADRMTHMSQRLMWTARRFARFNGEPCNVTRRSIPGLVCKHNGQCQAKTVPMIVIRWRNYWHC